MPKALQLLLGLATASAFTGPRRGVQRPQLLQRSSAAEPESRTTTAGRELAEALQNVNLYLIGMMGSGKTSVGELVSRQLGSYTFLDTDATLEAATKRTVADIFEKDGEAAFRELEGSIMEQVAAYVRLVVATGGGVVTRQQNWASLRQGIVVWLDPDVETLTARLSSGDEAGKRPLLQAGDVGATLAATLEKRREFYEQCDVRVSIQGEENASDTAARVVADALAFIRANPPKAAPGPPE
jgi:shikimate kinase